ncbi:hypothetical protein Metfor_1495 [Methanoregula formicica SMSP]|uniref:Uncharacterized protein n=1 Tax=Methanoregula formicica (strain DSM 22288 / NBRC 105244 / SMSP) TaxID=593750 RepID=L0HGS2_METFS|nr:hypothetical protein Metfor_1495 [Methanoregula formicica SMSP]
MEFLMKSGRGNLITGTHILVTKGSRSKRLDTAILAG